MTYFRLIIIGFLILFSTENLYSKGKKKNSNKAPHEATFSLREDFLRDFPHPPSFEDPVSQLCTYDQCQSKQYAFWLDEMKMDFSCHRKIWEWCYILQVLSKYDKLAFGQKGLGFGVGKEPLPSLFAKYGCTILATDQNSEPAVQHGWLPSAQSFSLQELYHPKLCSEEDFFSHVTYKDVDMNAIPDNVKDFDFVWSTCSLEHLGSIENGLKFILNSLKCLKKGGIAVHTTEFNLSSYVYTLMQGNVVLFRQHDIDRLIDKIKAQGHWAAPINLHPGTTSLDAFIDYPPYSPDGHLKLALGNYVTTSIGLFVVKN